MTTLVTIKNGETSNGDVILNAVNTCSDGSMKGVALRPGESKDIWITTSSMMVITETWPTKPKLESPDGGGSVIAACGDSGEKWAKAFVQQFPDADEDTLRAWFQNAIEAADTVRRERREVEATELHRLADDGGPVPD